MIHIKNIEVNYLARVEGEASIEVQLGKDTSVKLKIFEPPRFFEGFLEGRKFDEVGDIVSRICGICPVSHMTTAIQAIEQAMQIKVSPQTKILRNIMSISQIMASHLVHLYTFVMPDYYGYPSIVEMQHKFDRQIMHLIQMKEVINELTAVIGGRALHPVTSLPGGFTAIPSEEAFERILKKLYQIKPLAKQVVIDVSRFEIPDFHSDSEHVALIDENEYAINEGKIGSNKGLEIEAGQYLEVFREAEVSYAFAKKSTLANRSSFMVGALARLNNKFDKLHNHTKALAAEIYFQAPSDNPFKNILAQSLEVFDGVERCIQLIETNKFEDEHFDIAIRPGQGGSITEAPRGLLFHWYRVNENGVIEQANLVTPTSHNFQNIEKDLKKLVAENKDKKPEQIRLLCEKLVRAYDPCFSCSVH